MDTDRRYRTDRRVRPLPSAAALFAAALAAAVGSNASANTAPDEAAVAPIACTASSDGGLRTVWERYVQGLRDGQLAMLQSIFARDGSFHRVARAQDGRAETLAIRSFAEVLPSWAASADPHASGNFATASVDHNMAVIRGSLTFGGERYDDVLTLYCMNGHWQIVGKLTHATTR